MAITDPTPLHDHVALLVGQQGHNQLELRYSRHAAGMCPGNVWSYHLNAVRDAFGEDGVLLAVIADDAHEHPEVISGGATLPPRHMP